jgi:hypothetical protein
VLDVDPENYQAFIDLAQLHLFRGDGYVTTISEKKVFFQKAVVYAEGAMFTNPAFRQSIQQGKPTWEACRVLSVREMDAVFLWPGGSFTGGLPENHPLKAFDAGQIIWRFFQRY